jgi:hypothetical protein
VRGNLVCWVGCSVIFFSCNPWMSEEQLKHTKVPLIHVLPLPQFTFTLRLTQYRQLQNDKY